MLRLQIENGKSALIFLHYYTLLVNLQLKRITYSETLPAMLAETANVRRAVKTIPLTNQDKNFIWTIVILN